MLVFLLLLQLFGQDSFDPKKIPLPAGIRHNPEFSPDGKWIYYFETVKKPDTFSQFSRNEALFRTSLDGKTVEKVIEVGKVFGHIVWSPDGKSMALIRCLEDTNGDGTVDHMDGYSLIRCDPDGGNVTVLVKPANHMLSLYAITPDGRYLVSMRKSFAQRDPEIVLLDGDGKTEVVCKAWSYTPLDGKRGLVKVVESDKNGDGKVDYSDGEYHFFSLETKKRGKQFDADHVNTVPRKAHGKLWYSRRVDSNGDGKYDYQDNTVLAICDLDGKNHRDLTKGNEFVIPYFAHGEGLLCMLNTGPVYQLISYTADGGRNSIWKVESGSVTNPAVSRDGKRIVFAVIRDTKKDGKYYNWEDESDVYLVDMK